MRFVPSWHRAYVRSHRWGFVMAVGFFLTGMLGLLAPHLVSESSVALTLPLVALRTFYALWMLGGLGGSLGLLLARRELEIPGLALIAGGMMAYFITATASHGASLASILFVFIALGAIERAWDLFRYGYGGILR